MGGRAYAKTDTRQPRQLFFPRFLYCPHGCFRVFAHMAHYLLQVFPGFGLTLRGAEQERWMVGGADGNAAVLVESAVDLRDAAQAKEVT